jgi:hypothetical protein
MSHHQNEGQNHNKKTDNTSFENVTELKYFGNNMFKLKAD